MKTVHQHLQVELVRFQLSIKTCQFKTPNIFPSIKFHFLTSNQHDFALINQQQNFISFFSLSLLNSKPNSNSTAVKSIKKQHLVEVRSMANPPAIVKLALESICLLLGENASDWKSIRAVIMRENFINSIVSNFSTEMIK